MIHRTYITADLETTGLDHTEHGICEIGAVATDENGALLDIFHSLSCPAIGTPFDKKALEVNGFSASDICYDHPKEHDVIPKFAEFIEAFSPEAGQPDDQYETFLVFHNAKFDAGFLEVAYRRFNHANEHYSRLPVPIVRSELNLRHFRRVLCTQSLAFAVYGELVSLKDLGERLGIGNRKKHSALADAIQTSNIFHALNKTLHTAHYPTTRVRLYNNGGERVFIPEAPTPYREPAFIPDAVSPFQLDANYRPVYASGSVLSTPWPTPLR